MKVLVDCVPLAVGGGVQVAVGLLANLQTQNSVTWKAVLPNTLKPALPDALRCDLRLRFVDRSYPVSPLWLGFRLSEIEAEESPDVVFTVFGPAYFRAKAPHLVGFAIPHLIYDPEPWMPRPPPLVRLGNIVRRLLIRRADHVVVETETARQRLTLRCDIASERISVIQNSFNPLLRRIEDSPPRPQTLVVLTPSAWYPHKRLEFIPDIAASVRRRRPDLPFEFRLTLDSSSPSWATISARAATLGVADAIHTLGVLRVTDLPQAYASANMVLLPTIREVSTAVYPESFFFRRPLVTTDIDFARELCGNAALFASAQDAEAFANALIEIATKPAVAQQLILAGDQQLCAQYPSPTEKFEMQLALMQKVAAEGRRSG